MSADSERLVVKYRQLLRDLKTTVEGLLASQVPNLWSIYGGLNRLHVDVEKVFKHGCKTSTENNISGYWHFIQGLEWLYPDSSKSTLVVDCEYKSHFPQHIKNDKASIWLYRSLENHSLSQKLSWLLSDKTHLLACYQSSAYLCQTKYSEAILICLKAVERNELSLLTEIDPCLFLHKETVQVYEKRHRRCSSLPDTHFKNSLQIKSSKTVHELKPEAPVIKKPNFSIFKAWSSMPNLGLVKRNVVEIKRHTNPSTPVSQGRKISVTSLRSSAPFGSEQLNITPVKSKQGTKQLRPVIINNENIIEHTPPSTSCQRKLSDNYDLKSPLKSRFGKSPDLGFMNALAGEKDFKHKPKKTFIEDGGMSILPTATGYFPRPRKGQTLTSFLSSSQFSRANAELDRENAHFSISEAMIAVIEQIRCGRSMKLIDDQADDSDEEINHLKQRIRLRRKEKLEEKQKRLLLNSLASERADCNPTEGSPCSSSPGSYSLSSGGVEDLDIDELSSYLFEQEGLSMSMASLYSEADVLRRPRGAPDGASDILSAEGVALSLISRFNEKQLPRASELEWIVSEEDAPQALLPLPKTWPISSEDPQDASAIPLRGTQEWAPPRPQIIFTLHPAPVRKELMAKQDYRCAGCGMRVAQQYASKFRYCHYLGRYFCTGCHTNQVAVIPARIIQKWDFARYPVSNFSYRLIEQMYVDPLFRVFELNKNIAKRSANLVTCKTYRIGLHYMKDFILNCRFAETIQDYLNCERGYLFSDPELFSLEDLVSIRSGEMKSQLRCVIEMCWRHILECELCSARGFICEICKNQQVIFPWQQRTVSRCDKCGTCFHLACWTNTAPCLRCVRISKRKSNLQDNSCIGNI